MSRPGTTDGLAIEVEIRAEKASALRRVATKLEALIAELTQLASGLSALSGSARDAAVARHRELRAEAEKQQWYLIVQREAMGLRNHRDVYEIYRLPPAVK